MFIFHFLPRGRKRNNHALPENGVTGFRHPVPRSTLRVVQPADEASPHAAMRRYHVCSGAHPAVSGTARLASRDALPGSMVLAASTG